MGYHVELMGWEDTVAVYGRPQQIINQEVDRCDLFIGMIWKRWGSPPDRDGKFTSGFQEEFERAVERRERSGSPEISLFLKEISNDEREDPGESLKKVMEFREKIIADKKVLYQEFSVPQQMERLGRKCITAYVQKLSAASEPSETSEARVKQTDPGSEQTAGDKSGPESSPLSAEGYEFLRNLIDKFGQEHAMNDISPSDIARFRLLANSISKSGNEEMVLGVHDLNILFAARAEGAKLGKKETICLARLGLQNLDDENVPFWRWYSDLSDFALRLTFFSCCFGANDDEKLGAMRVLTLRGQDIPKTDENLTRDHVLKDWFSEDSPTRIRSAALDYLTTKGTAEDASLVRREYDRNDPATSRKALECLLEIHLRTKQGILAQQVVLESQFESLDSNVLQAVLARLEELETTTLILGLEHRNAQVRLKTLEVLLRRGSLDDATVERLCKDSDASVRHETVKVLEKLGRSFSEEEAKEILVQPRRQSDSGLFGNTSGSSDWQGEEHFKRYQLAKFKKLPESELTRKVEDSFLFDDAAYFARAARYFAKYAEVLRRDIDDGFHSYFEERIRRMKTILSVSTGFIKSFQDLEDYHRKQLTVKGLDILCRAGRHEDLQRIRCNLKNGKAPLSMAQIGYLGKYGAWDDISLLVHAETSYAGGIILTGLEGRGDFPDQVARIALTMSSGHSISKFFALDIPATILKKTIELCAESRFSRLSDEVLFILLKHESESVRKAACLKAVRTFSAKRVGAILKDYISSDQHHYYNVIHWLDLGVSMPRDEARQVARAAMV